MEYKDMFKSAWEFGKQHKVVVGIVIASSIILALVAVGS